MTENIRDHGGVEGDDSKSAISANITAIHEASTAANDNTVYLPEGTWYIGAPPNAWGGFGLFAGHDNTSRGAAGLGFVGDGPEKSILKWGYVKDGYNNAIRYSDDVASHDNVVWRDLTYDGDYQNLTFGTDGSQRAMQFQTATTATFDNVRIANFHTEGISAGDGTIDVDRCTFRDIGVGRQNQGNGSSQSLAMYGDMDLTVTNSEATLIVNSLVDYGNGASGDLVIDNVYVSGSGVGLLKINDIGSVDISRVNYTGQTQELVDAQTTGHGGPENKYGRFFVRRFDGNDSSAVPVSINNIEARKLTRGAFRLSGGYDIDLSSTTAPMNFEDLLLDSFTEQQNQGEVIESYDGSDYSFDVNELAVSNTDGVVFDVADSTGTVDEVQSDNTDGLSETGNVTIENHVTNGSLYDVSMPTKDVVGVNSASDSDTAPTVSWTAPNGGATVSGSVTIQLDASDAEDSDDSLTVEYRVDGGTWTGTTYNTDTGYYEDTWDTTTVADGTHTLEARATDSGGTTSTDTIDLVVGAIFEEWTPQWLSTADDWGVVSGSAYTGGYALAFDPADDTGGRYAISADQVGTPADVEVLDRFRVPEFTDGDPGSHAWLHLRASGSAGNESSYWVEVMDRKDSFRLGKYTNGSSTGLKRFGTPVENTFYYRRFRAEGDTLKVKIWEADQSEPSNWDVELTDTDLADGWIGPGSWDPKLSETDTFNVATGGATAEFAGTDSTPGIAWASPADGDVVGGGVTVQLDASDAEDSDDSLTVEYRVDGGTWTGITYNTDTGYYEDTWDSSAVTDGDHTLEARATDSAGNTSTATITVTTDNADNAPTVDSLSLSEVETDDPDAAFDASWEVSDGDSDLDSADLALIQDSDGSAEDSELLNVTGGNAAGTTRLVAADDDGSGNSYTVELTVTDDNGATTSDTASASETESTSSSAPSINRFSVSEANRPDPHAELTVVWDVSDPDGDLEALEIDITDSSGAVQSVTWSLNGARASDTDSFRIKDGDGKTFDVTLTVTDAAGQSTSKATSVTA